MGTSESETYNPYAAPLVGLETVDPFQQDDTRIRQQFIDCEANVHSIAELLMCGGIIVAGVCVVMAFNFVAVDRLAALGAAVLLASTGLAGIVQLIVGLRVRAFRPRARIGAIIFCALWLLFLPLGTIFGGVCLWYLLRPAAKYVFTEEYRDIIRRTPHVQFRTSSASWGILIAVVLGLAGLIVVANLRY